MKTSIAYYFLIIILFISCSVEKKSITSLAWHNTNARYNGYYLAKEKIREAENTVYEARKDNFNRILQIYTPIDENISNSINSKLEEAIKKASLPIQYHKNSKWVDNCYILIGKARYYKLDFENAIITFKYINTISDDEQDKAEALIWLARCYTITDQMEFAMGVLNHVRKIHLNKNNTELLAFAECEVYQKLDYINPFAKNIEIAAENPTSKRNKSRSNFIAGQTFQQLGDDEKAFYHYKKCLKTHPPYELEFYTKLNMAQVTSFENNDDIKKIKKYFKKLLKDFKNIDYKDKIYYEMAKFELKQKKIKPAIEYLNQSIQASTTNTNQKAFSYLKLGEIYYDLLQEYRKASNYYDSTMMFLSKDESNYTEIDKRTKILKEFVTQLEIIELEDSLQVLANMDSTELIKLIDNNIKKEIAEKKRLEDIKKKKEDAEKKKATDNPDELGNPNDWYFYNPTTLAKGKNEFLETWGDRKLEDNWRRSSKTDFANAIEDDETTTEQTKKDSSSTNNVNLLDQEAKLIITQRNAILSQIPFTKEKKEISNKKIENAYSSLGNIYHLKLEELQKANDTYEKLLERFPNHKNKIEVYYILFIINSEINKERAEYYKKLLLTQYENSIYAKLVLDPEYLVKNWELNKQAELMYSNAYTMYEQGNYHEAIAKCNEIEKQYPENYIHDKIQLLKILNISKLEGIIEYKKLLEAYIITFKDSPLKETAISYLKECNDYITKEITSASSTSQTETGIFNKEIEGEQYFIMLIPQNKGVIFNNLLVNLSEYNDNFNKDGKSKLEVKQMIFNTDYLIILVKTFDSKSKALLYKDKMDVEKIVEMKNLKIETFTITQTNFSILYKTKAKEEYSTFFKNVYF